MVAAVVDPTITTTELASQLTLAGLEVDSIEPAAPVFSGVVVGEVIALKPHPQADRLQVARWMQGRGNLGRLSAAPPMCGSGCARRSRCWAPYCPTGRRSLPGVTRSGFPGNAVLRQ